MRFSAAEAGEPNLGYIAENLRVQWALHQSPQDLQLRTICGN